MKKLTLFVFSAILFCTFAPMQLNATLASVPITTTAAKPSESVQASTWINRLNEIKAMDKSTLSSAEKQDLRKEVRTIRKSLKAAGGGMYLSVGAIIIIILLLILLV